MGRLKFSRALALTPLILTVAALATPTSAAPTLDAGVKLYQAHDYAGALAVWRPLAVQSDPNALFNLGQAYRLGHGVKANPKQAATYYEQAAKLGHVAAQGNLATLLYFGESPLKDTKRAVELYHVAARNGDARAQYMLGVLYFNGEEVAKSWPRAYAYTSLAEDAGLPEAASTSAKLTQFLKPDDIAEGKNLKATLISSAPDAPTVLAGSKPPVGVKIPGIMVARAAKPAVAWTTASATVAAPAASSAAAAFAPAVVPEVVAMAAPKQPTGNMPAVLSGDKPVSEVASGATIPPAPALPTAPTIIIPPIATTALPDARTVALPSNTKKPAPKVAAVQPVANTSSGGWRVQLGAYASQAAAEAQWNNQHGKAIAAVGSVEPSYVAVGGVTKLQVGSYANHDAAAKACGLMKAKGLGCFPVKS